MSICSCSIVVVDNLARKARGRYLPRNLGVMCSGSIFDDGDEDGVGVVRTSGMESQVNQCISSFAMQSIRAARFPFLRARATAKVISSLIWRLQARKFAQVFGARREAKAQPLFPRPLLGSHGRHQLDAYCVEESLGVGSCEVMTSVYIMSRSSRGRSKNCGMVTVKVA